MKKAGLVVAIEMGALTRKFGEPLETIKYRNETIYKYHTGDFELYAIRSGVGEIAASASAELLITKFDVEYLFNFGVVGGLTEEISKHRICVVDKVVHYDFDTSKIDHCEPGRYIDLYPTVYIPTNEHLKDLAIKEVPDLKPVICASGDKFVDDAEARIAINKQFKAKYQLLLSYKLQFNFKNDAGILNYLQNKTIEIDYSNYKKIIDNKMRKFQRQ